MLRDTIQKLHDDYNALGGRMHTFKYNDVDFQVSVKAVPRLGSTNQNSMRKAELNEDAMRRKLMMGMGHGQYCERANVRLETNGLIELQTRVNGKNYNIPIEVSSQGVYKSKVLNGSFSSLRDVCAKVMDGVFEFNGVDNPYKSTTYQIGHRGRPANSVSAPAPSFGRGM